MSTAHLKLVPLCDGCQHPAKNAVKKETRDHRQVDDRPPSVGLEGELGSELTVIRRRDTYFGAALDLK